MQLGGGAEGKESNIFTALKHFVCIKLSWFWNWHNYLHGKSATICYLNIKCRRMGQRTCISTE